MTIQQVSENWLKQKEKELILNYVKLGLKASGAWGKSLEDFYNQSTKGISMGIKANDYTEYLENGRAPNKKSSHKDLVKFAAWSVKAWAAEWVANKAPNLDPFAVAYNIGKKGIKVPNRYNAGGLVSDVITEKSINELIKEIGSVTLENLTSEITGMFKKGEA